ncbi:glycosyl hydrolase 5 family protein-like [Phragmites australis]|uniref:glycosyl hydrolase 5 family protein-like n=1 Tax=Phragmites australis TaxID=29695 RepID=UPI002D7732F5|nr:glycosyl hydrolase 5 family protein-like [Phragmites australis]
MKLALASPRAAQFILLVLLLVHRERAAAVTLSTSSRWIVDEAGHRVKLACVNWPSHLEPVVTEGLGRQPVGNIATTITALGFNCVRLTYPITLATNASLSSITVRQSLLAHGLAETIGGVEVNNPGFLDLTLIESFKAVVNSLGENNVMVILDNHVSKPAWCCGNDDGNGFFGDRDFDPDVWVDGLGNMATIFAGVPNVVGMSLRNELRGPRQNSQDWYTYMQRGAEAVHAANPRALVIMGGLSYDYDLSFLDAMEVSVSFAAENKLVFELHWYSFSDARAWELENANEVCGRAALDFARRGGFLLSRGFPLFLSEFGADFRGGDLKDNRYYPCAAAVAAELDLDWAFWALQGSYALRQGVAGMDEVYGVLDWSWSKPRNETVLPRIQALQRPLQGPGYAEALPYTVLFHPLTGLCAVRCAATATTLELGPCNETDAWAYAPPASKLVLRDAAAAGLPCLRAEGRGQPARLSAEACGDALSTWRLASDSAMHVAVDAAPGLRGGGMLCLDVGADGRSIVTNPCACLRGDGGCDPERQWFKLITSTRRVAHKPATLA